jgi:hypothetical protein
VITAVASGDYIFIASSMKGKNIFYAGEKSIRPPGAIKDSHFWQGVRGICHPQIISGLEQCEKALPDGELVGHKNGGSCGEVMAAWAMCDIVGDAHVNPAKVVAVEYYNNEMVIKDPCGDAAPNVSLQTCKICAEL